MIEIPKELVIAGITALAVVLVALGYFVRDWLSLRTRMMNIEVDDTKRRKELSAEAQELIQRTYGQQVDELRHQRDLIDDLGSKYATVVAEKAAAERELMEVKQQQIHNVEELKTLKDQVKELHNAELERDKLKQVVADLTQQVNDYETRAESRHQEMSTITGINFELNTKLRVMTTEFKTAYQLLKDCYATTDKVVPDFASLVEDKAQSSASSSKESSHES
jgi:chromosome segregation ATPase